ncbi:MAG: hypothetical protein ACO3A4_07945 [Silvanigrellaceae bacterium]
MLMQPSKTVRVVASVSLLALAACGRPEDQSSPDLEQMPMASRSEQGLAFFADTSSIQDVSLKDKDGSATVVTPSYLPKAGQSAVELTVVFYPKLSVPAQSKFVYDKSKWTIVVGKNTQYVTGVDVLEIQEDGNFSAGEVREGQIKMRIRLTTLPQWPDKLTNDAALDLVDGRKALKIQPYYSLEGAVPPGNAGTIQGLSAAYMKDDIGAIVGSSKIGSTVVSDGAFSFDFSPPDDTTAADTSTGSITSVGKSNVSGFIVVYWKDSECKAGGWTFKPNKIFDKTKANGDLACTYPGIDEAVAGSTSCSLGCTTDAVDDFFGKTANDIAIPPEFPASNGTANAIKRGCLNIVRVASDGRTSYAVNDAINGENYGMMVYPLDSAGNIGMSRSRCLKAKSFDVVFPSSKKSPDLGKSKSDCFVVTAASGSTQSPAVHYWRVLRDTWLDRLGVSAFYYKHGPKWAAWLESNPRFKPTFNSFFEWSGRNLVKVSQEWNRFRDGVQDHLKRFTSMLSQAIVSEARADDAPAPGEIIGLKHPNGSAATTLTIAGGQIRPSEDKELYDLSYKDKKPAFLFVAQSFRLFDFWGELGLGYEFGGVSMEGTSADANKAKISLSGYGAGILGEYRLRIGEYPWVSPRFSYVFGKMRMREEAAAVASETTSTQSGSSGGGSSSEISPSGTTPVWQTYTTLRGSLDLSITRLYGDDENLIRYGYEVEDMMLTLFAGLHTNNGKVISTSGLQLGGGISFLFK